MEKSGRIRVRICGEQTDAAGAVQHTEMRAMARHDVKNGTHYLRYEDTTLLAGQAVPSLLKIAPASLTLVRHGAVEQRLEFVPRAERVGVGNGEFVDAHPDITERLLEAASRGQWAQPDPATLAALQQQYLAQESTLEARAEGDEQP